MRSRKENIELMTLRRPTKVDALIDSIPKPKNAVPKKGLPLWSVLPLEAKLPVLRGPKRELVFTRDKIGKKLWQNPNQKEFILYDPNCLDVSYHYDSFHDENLRRFFAKHVNRKRMFELGLITKEGDAICSLKDFNEYRRYLKRVHQDAINRERVRMEEKELERFLLWKAKQIEERDMVILARKRVRNAKKRHHYERMAAERGAKEQAQAANQARNANRVLMMERRKLDEHNRMIKKAIDFDIKIKQKKKQGEDIERKRKIKAMRKWHDNEVERRRRMVKEKWRKIMEKEWKEYHTLHTKTACQEARLERQRKLVERYEREMALKTEIRRKNVEHARLKMEDRIMKDKAERVRVVSEHAWSIKAMVKALCKAWEDRLKFKSPEEIKQEKSLIEKTIQLQMAEYKNKTEGKEVFAILQGARRKLDKLFGVPERVSVAVDSLLNNVIMAYTRKRVSQIIGDTLHQAEAFKKQHEAAVREHQKKKLLAIRASQVAANANVAAAAETSASVEKTSRRASIHPTVDVIGGPSRNPSSMKTRSTTRSLMKTGTVSSVSLGKPSRLVSFGTIVTVEKLKELAASLPNTTEVKETDENLLLVRRTKDRPPTPVPSMSDLVNAAFNDPLTLDAFIETDIEKNNLDRQLGEFSKNLVMHVLKKADMKAENKRKQLYRQLSNQYIDRDVVITGITDAILHSEVNLMDLPEVDHISDVLAKELIVKRAAHVFHSSLPLPKSKADKVELLSVKSERVESPSVKSERVESPSVKSERVESPAAKSERVESPSVKSERVESPAAKSERAESPSVKSERAESPAAKPAAKPAAGAPPVVKKFVMNG